MIGSLLGVHTGSRRSHLHCTSRLWPQHTCMGRCSLRIHPTFKGLVVFPDRLVSSRGLRYHGLISRQRCPRFNDSCRAGTQPARKFATLGLSELEPPLIYCKALGTSQLLANLATRAKGCDNLFPGNAEFVVRRSVRCSRRALFRVSCVGGYSIAANENKPTSEEIVNQSIWLCIASIATCTEHHVVAKLSRWPIEIVNQ